MMVADIFICCGNIRLLKTFFRLGWNIHLNLIIVYSFLAFKKLPQAGILLYEQTIVRPERRNQSLFINRYERWFFFYSFFRWIGSTLQKKTLNMSIRGRLQNDGQHRRMAGVLVADGSSRMQFFSWRQVVRKLVTLFFCNIDLVASSFGDNILFLITIHKEMFTNIMHIVG